MKTTIKTLSTLIFVLTLSTVSFAQVDFGSDEATIEAVATIQASLTVTPDPDHWVSFGIIHTDNATGEQSPVQGGEGKFTLKGTQNAQVELDFILEELTLEGGNGSGNETMPLNAGPGTGAWEETDGGQFPTTNTFDLNAGTEAELASDDGKIFIWVRPTITVDQNQKPGKYKGYVTLNASYTGV